MPRYLVVDGAFSMGDGRTVGPGETIELDADVAQAHALRLRPAPEQQPAPSDHDAGDAAPESDG